MWSDTWKPTSSTLPAGTTRPSNRLGYQGRSPWLVRTGIRSIDLCRWLRIKLVGCTRGHLNDCRCHTFSAEGFARYPVASLLLAGCTNVTLKSVEPHYTSESAPVRYRWQHQTAQLTSVYGTDDGKTLWAVGERGTILHSTDGATWETQTSGGQGLLWGRSVRPSSRVVGPDRQARAISR